MNLFSFLQFVLGIKCCLPRCYTHRLASWLRLSSCQLVGSSSSALSSPATVERRSFFATLAVARWPSGCCRWAHPHSCGARSCRSCWASSSGWWTCSPSACPGGMRYSWKKISQSGVVRGLNLESCLSRRCYSARYWQPLAGFVGHVTCSESLRGATQTLFGLWLRTVCAGTLQRFDLNFEYCSRVRCLH